MNAFSQYIGTPWEAGAQGPESYDCWAFFRMLQRSHFGIDVPVIMARDINDAGDLVALFRGHEEATRWAIVDKPKHGDGVVIHRPLHVGVWLDIDGGGVLHCVRGAGVVFTKDADWRLSGFGRREFRSFVA